MLYLKFIIFWGSYLIFPIMLFLIIFLQKKKRFITLGLTLLVGTLFVWARFIEPQIIKIQETTILTGWETDVVLISDLHLGIYKGSSFLERVVSKINALEASSVLIAGDFSYEPQRYDLDTLFEPLTDINKSVYAVLGNHDVEQPGPPIRKELTKALEKAGVIVLQNQAVDLERFTLVGLGSHFANEDEASLLQEHDPQQTLVLTHNPDTIEQYNSGSSAAATLVGHTHCGQIRIPGLYKGAIPTKGDFDKGLTQEDWTQLYISCGLGEVVLPLRLFNPPTIDVIRFR